MNSIDKKIKEELKNRKLIKKRIKIMNKGYGIEEIDLENFGIVNPTGYQVLNKTLIEIYMERKVPEKSDGKVTIINVENAKTMIIEYNSKKDYSIKFK